MRRLERTILWQWLHRAGIEYCNLWSTDQGWTLEGTVLTAVKDEALRIQYEVLCTKDWKTHKTVANIVRGSREQRIELTVDKEQRWWKDNSEIQEVRGCYDVDLGFSPSTNTLPIQRLNLAVGANAGVKAAWLRFPEFTVLPLDQRYTRIDARRFRYESRDGAFQTEIETDDLGLVSNYVGYWKQIAAV